MKARHYNDTHTQALAYAEASPYPDAAEMLTDVYA